MGDHPALPRLTQTAAELGRALAARGFPTGSADDDPVGAALFADEGSALPADAEGAAELSPQRLRAVLRSGAVDERDRALVSAAYAHLARERIDDWFVSAVPEPGSRDLYSSLLAVNVYTDLDAFRLVDELLEGDAATFWIGLERFVDRTPDLPAPARLAALVALAGADATSARDAANRLRRPELARLSGAEKKEVMAAPPQLVVEGRRGARPRGAVTTTLLLVSGLLPVGALLTGFARLFLGLRRPVTLRVSGAGVSIEQETRVIGRLLRTSRRWVPVRELMSVTRERRFARAGLVAAVLILIACTYVGAGLVADGLKLAGSRSLLATGLCVLAAGVVLHFVLASWLTDVRGRCTLLLKAHGERPFVVTDVAPTAAEALLDALQEVPAEPRSAKAAAAARG